MNYSPSSDRRTAANRRVSTMRQWCGGEGDGQQQRPPHCRSTYIGAAVVDAAVAPPLPDRRKKRRPCACALCSEPRSLGSAVLHDCSRENLSLRTRYSGAIAGIRGHSQPAGGG